jgi:hypothetical protein
MFPKKSMKKFAVRAYSSRISFRIFSFSAVANFSDVFEDLVIFIVSAPLNNLFRFLRQPGSRNG